MAPVLEIEDLSTHIRLSRGVVEAVNNVSLSIEPGETLGLVGESGCGKSMTGLSIMRLLPSGGRIVSGSIKLDGRDLVRLDKREMRAIRGNDVAMVFQDSLTSLNPTMTIGEQIAEPVLQHRRTSRSEALERAAELLGVVGFPEPRKRLGDYPHRLSGGQRQRVMIAIALSCEPKLLIADEPTTALDVTIQAQILGLLDDLKEWLGMAVLLISHDMGLVASRADRVNVMYAGRIVEVARTGPLFKEMRHPYTQALIASIPLLTQNRTERLFSIAGSPPDLMQPPHGCRFAPRCGRVTEKCVAREPPLIGPSHDCRFACWHPVDGPARRPLLVDGATAPVPPHGERGEAPALDTSLVLGHRAEARAGDAPYGAHLGDDPGGDAGRFGGASGRDLLVLTDVVREYSVTSGAVLMRKVGSIKAVSGVSFKVGRAQTFGLVGESGCGKTTLGKIIVAIEKPDAGGVTLGGTDVSRLRERELRRFRRDLQMVFQDPIASLDPHMRVGAILREPMMIQGGASRRQQDHAIRDLLAEVGLPASAVERFPHEFSSGQVQRIALARALTLNPQVIVADEPVSALDVSVRSQVLNLMRRLQELHGLTYVVISHDLAVVKYLSDRIGVMYLGKLVEVADGEEIYRHPVHHYTAGLIAAIPEPDPSREKAKVPAAIRGELPSPVDPPSGCRFHTRCHAAQEICAVEEPTLRAFGPGHFAACHFPLQSPLTTPLLSGV